MYYSTNTQHTKRSNIFLNFQYKMLYIILSHENQLNSDAKVLIWVNSHFQNDQNIQLYARGSLTCDAFYCGSAFNVENRLIIIHSPHKWYILKYSISHR